MSAHAPPVAPPSDTRRHSAAAVCWVCGSADVVHWRARTLSRALIPADLEVTDTDLARTLTLWRCRSCGFGFADARDLVELTALHGRVRAAGALASAPEGAPEGAPASASESPGAEPVEGASANGRVTGPVGGGAEGGVDARARQVKRALRWALAHHRSARAVLDLGARSAALAAAGERLGVEVVGVGLHDAFVPPARCAEGARLDGGCLVHPALEGRSFDVVLLVDVLEHVCEPVALLAAAARALAPDGLLVVITPDAGSATARRLRHRWWHFRLAHVGYFTARSLSAAAAAAGLRVVAEAQPVWYFRLRQLAHRAAAYIPPLAPLNRLAPRVPPMRWLYDRVVPVNLGDALLVLLRHEAAPSPAGADGRTRL